MARRIPCPRKTGAVVVLAVGFLVACSAALALVWTHLRAIDLGYKISRATEQRAKLQETNRRLRIEIALLKAPARIAQAAQNWGLAAPEPEQIKRLRLPDRAQEQRVARKARKVRTVRSVVVAQRAQSRSGSARF